MFQKNRDEKLIGKALNGSQRSWVNLVKRYENLVFNYCLRMTFNRSDAMDLMQEVFLAVYRNLPSYRASGQFKGWMMRIAANKTTDFLRARARNPLHQAAEVSEESCEGEFSLDKLNNLQTHQDPATQHAQINQNRQIKSLLSHLSLEQKLIIELKFFQYFTFEQISQQTNCPINTVKTRFYKALVQLKDHAEIQNVM